MDFQDNENYPRYPFCVVWTPIPLLTNWQIEYHILLYILCYIIISVDNNAHLKSTSALLLSFMDISIYRTCRDMYTDGVIRDFAGSYFVSEDKMGFGVPTKYWKLNPDCVKNGAPGWDAAVAQASTIYGKKLHNLFLQNCHSHVCTALNLMEYERRTNWNGFILFYKLSIHGKYINTMAWMKTWCPFFVNIAACGLIYFSAYS